MVAGTAPSAGAQTQSIAALIAQLTAQVERLQAQLAALKEAQTVVQETQEEARDTLKLINQLKEGMSGEEVQLLQTILAADADTYPEGLLTGYFGKATAKALKKFQKKHGLIANGALDQKTIEKLNEFLTKRNLSLARENDDDDDRDHDRSKKGRGGRSGFCVLVPPGHLIAPGWLRKQGNDVLVPVCTSIPQGIAKKLPWWLSTSTPPFPTSTKDVIPPVLSSTTVTNLSSSTATLSWTTNELARAKVYYATTPSFPLAQASSSVRNTFLSSHSFALSGLTPATTYFYVTEARDVWGNTATSSYQSFTTAPGPDLTPPLITSLAASSISTSSASVTWTTNEPATSRVYYGTSTQIATGTTPSVFDGSYVTSHMVTLPSLLASSTYHYMVESKDGAGNTATSTEASFVTL